MESIFRKLDPNREKILPEAVVESPDDSSITLWDHEPGRAAVLRGPDTQQRVPIRFMEMPTKATATIKYAVALFFVVKIQVRTVVWGDPMFLGWSLFAA